MSEDLPELLEVEANEAQVLRLFAIRPGSSEEARLSAASAQGAIVLSELAGEMLGGVQLDPAWLELVNQKDVESMGGLEAYLRAGYDPPESSLEALRPALETAPRRLLIVLSRAFSGQAAHLDPVESLTAIAAVSLSHAPPTAQPMPAQGAPAPLDAKVEAKAGMSKGRVSGMVALAALLVIAALTVVVVLIGG